MISPSVKKPPSTLKKLVVLHVYKDFHIYNALFGTLLLLARHNDYSKIDLRLCIFNYRRSPWGDEFETLGGKIIDLDARWSQSPLVTFKLIKCLRREQPDIVQTHELKANLYGRLAALWVGIPVIIGTLHTLKDTAPSPMRRLRDRILHPLSAWLDRRSDCVLTTSDAVRREWDSTMQSPLYRTIYPPFISHRSVAETHFPLPLSDSHLFRIGVVARLSEEKGLQLLLAAMPLVLISLPNAMLFIAGDGRMRSELESLTTRLRLFSRVHFLGHVGDVPSFLPKLDLYVQPSRSDSLPLAVMEALAAGLPVITTRVGGLPEIVTDGTNGRLVPPNDVGALAEAILALGRNVEERRRLGHAGRETMRQRFQVPEFLREMDCLYTELAAKVADRGSANLART
jgi:glycosyltransferase involved in cell wall biosynthesis